MNETEDLDLIQEIVRAVANNGHGDGTTERHLSIPTKFVKDAFAVKEGIQSGLDSMGFIDENWEWTDENLSFDYNTTPADDGMGLISGQIADGLVNKVLLSEKMAQNAQLVVNLTGNSQAPVVERGVQWAAATLTVLGFGPLSFDQDEESGSLTMTVPPRNEEEDGIAVDFENLPEEEWAETAQRMADQYGKQMELEVGKVAEFAMGDINESQRPFWIMLMGELARVLNAKGYTVTPSENGMGLVVGNPLVLSDADIEKVAEELANGANSVVKETLPGEITMTVPEGIMKDNPEAGQVILDKASNKFSKLLNARGYDTTIMPNFNIEGDGPTDRISVMIVPRDMDL